MHLCQVLSGSDSKPALRLLGQVMAERALFVQVPAVNHVLVPRQRGLQLAGNPAPPGRALRRALLDCMVLVRGSHSER